MENRILVTYASSSGSTQEVAEAVAQALRSHKLEVDLLPMRKVRELGNYNAVVLGISIYMFHWHKDAQHFLARFQRNLSAGIPAVVFTGGPFSKGDEKEWQVIREQVAKELARYAWFQPLSVEIVGGRFDPAKLRLPYSLLPALRQMPANDLRDWTAILGWVERIIPALLTVKQTTTSQVRL